LNPATLHPLGTYEAFTLWEIDFVGPVHRTPRGNRYLITAIDYGTSLAIAWPIPKRSTEAALEMLEHIYWSWGKPDVILSDNGTEFLDEFDAALNRYGIRHKRTTPAHPQTNGKVERWNHELMNRLQRIAAEEGNNRRDWDLYVRQGLFAFHAHYNSRLGCTPFYLQYGVEPILPSQHSLTSKPLTNVERMQSKQDRQQRVQNLNKYRTDAANRYMKAMKRLASSRDNSAFTKGPIIKGDLVMRKPLNRKSKLHPK